QCGLRAARRPRGGGGELILLNQTQSNACRVGKGVGTEFNTNERLSCAVPTNSIDASGAVHGGHGARQAYSRGEALHAPLPTLQVRCTLSPLRHTTRACNRIRCRFDARNRGLQCRAVERFELELEPARLIDQGGVEGRCMAGVSNELDSWSCHLAPACCFCADRCRPGSLGTTRSCLSCAVTSRKWRNAW